MNFSFFIASKYFVSKSKQKVINLINFISLFLVIIASASLIIVLSAFSGLKNYGLSFSNSFDPDFRIEPKTGKTLFVNSSILDSIQSIKEIEAVAPIIEEKIFLTFREKNHVAYLKGVDSSYHKVIPIKKLIGTGQWFNSEYDEVIVGSGIAKILSLGVYDYNDFLLLAAIKKPPSLNIFNNPFNSIRSLVSGIYSSGEEIDSKYLFSSSEFARKLFETPENYYSYIYIKSNANAKSKTLLKKITPILKDSFIIKTKKELNPVLYKMLNTENVAVYLIFTLIVIIALFNVVGALIMMILEKKPNLKILNAIGVNKKAIRKIFFYLGLMISWIGGIIGILIGGILLIIQYYHPFLFVPGTSLPYPVSFEFKNLILVIITLMILGGITSFWVTSNFNKNLK